MVIIILAGAVILTMSDNDPFDAANQALFKNDLDNFRSELMIYENSQFLNKLGNYDINSLEADATNIGGIISKLNNNSKYSGKLKIEKGQLIFICTGTIEDDWAKQIGITVECVDIDNEAPTVTLESVVSTSTTITVKATAVDNGNSGINENSYQYSKDDGATWEEQTNLTTYTFSNLSTGEYKIKVKVADNAGNVGESSTSLTISTQTLGIITFNPSTTSLTKNDITVEIIYPTELVTKKYKIGNGEWIDYTGVITITENAIIHAIGYDSANNSTTADLTIDRIDKLTPSITLTNSGSTSSTITVVANASDNGVAGIDANSYQYSRDNGATWTSTGNTTSYTFTGLSTATTYQCKVKVKDMVGNESISSAVGITTSPYQSSPAPVTGCGGAALTVNSTINGQLPAYNNPVIPAGFVPVNTTDASWNLSGGIPQGWNNGLVIQDSNCNEFVWVPVDGTNVRNVRNLSYPYNISSGTTPTSSNMDDGYIPEMEASKYNVSKNQGFYVGRYEAYNNGSKVGLKKNTSSWTLNFNDAYYYCANMDTHYGYDTSKVGTNLITGIQWDSIMNWISNSGKSVTDSRNWGNYEDSTSPANVYGHGSMQNTGYSDAWRAKNIYDLAGNGLELTAEVQIIGSLMGCTMRGGQYTSSGSSVPASHRILFADFSANYRPFRVALYIL